MHAAPEKKVNPVVAPAAAPVPAGEGQFAFQDNRREAVFQRQVQSMADSYLQRQVAPPVALLPPPVRPDKETVQRKVEEYRDETGANDLAGIAGKLNDAVLLAKKLVDSNPLLKDIPDRTVGYLGAWVKCFNEFLTSGEVPTFFFARYGYAIETLATNVFRAEDIKPYKAMTQVSHGGTRPDFVIFQKSNEVAWLDITSSASKGHIFNKDGGGWNNKPYVAEILYDMPHPSNFTDSAAEGLNEEQLKALKQADTAKAERVFLFTKGMTEMGLILGTAYHKYWQSKGEGLSREEVRTITVQVCKEKMDKFLDKGVTPGIAAGVLASIESIEVGVEINTGLSWANWAFKNTTIKHAEGRALLYDFGKSLG